MVPLMQIFITQIDYTYREKGNLKLAESIFNSIEVSNDSNHNNKFSKSYKMAVSFKLNNAEFLHYLFLLPLNQMYIILQSMSLQYMFVKSFHLPIIL